MHNNNTNVSLMKVKFLMIYKSQTIQFWNDDVLKYTQMQNNIISKIAFDL